MSSFFSNILEVLEFNSPLNILILYAFNFKVKKCYILSIRLSSWSLGHETFFSRMEGDRKISSRLFIESMI